MFFSLLLKKLYQKPVDEIKKIFLFKNVFIYKTFNQIIYHIHVFTITIQKYTC